MSLKLREELAHVDVASVDERCAEAVAAARFSGSLHVLGGDAPEGPGPYWVLRLQVGAVARRLYRTLADDLDVRPSVEVHRPTGPQRSRGPHTGRYQLSIALPRPDAGAAGPGLRRLELVTAGGELLPAPQPPAAPAARRGWLRGALMSGASLSSPEKPPHLEIRCPSRSSADALVEVLAALGAPGAAATTRGGGSMTNRPSLGDAPRHRVVVKSGRQIGAVLIALGSHHAFLERDLAALERRLRSDANRAANADRANLDRAASAAVRQIAEIEEALAETDPADIPADVLETALARLANPGATLGEIGALLQPPIGRATVHRRLKRLVDRAPPRRGRT